MRSNCGRLSKRRLVVYPRPTPPSNIASPDSEPRWNYRQSTAWRELFSMENVTIDTLPAISTQKLPIQVMRQLVRHAYRDPDLPLDHVDTIICTLPGYHAPDKQPHSVQSKREAARNSYFYRTDPIHLEIEAETSESSTGFFPYCISPRQSDSDEQATKISAAFPPQPMHDSVMFAENLHESVHYPALPPVSPVTTGMAQLALADLGITSPVYATQFEASPVRDRFLSQYDLQVPISPLAEYESHVHHPGVNDLMSGAIVTDSERLEVPKNDNLDASNNLGDQLRYMRWRVLNPDELVRIPGLFRDVQKCLNSLGPNFRTTNEGLRRAIEEVRDTDTNRSRSNDLDSFVIGALAKRGGEFERPDTRCELFYPEDMHPVYGDLGLLDESYWRELYKASTFWKGLQFLGSLS